MKTILIKGKDHEFDDQINKSIADIESKTNCPGDGFIYRGVVKDVKFQMNEEWNYALILWTMEISC